MGFSLESQVRKLMEQNGVHDVASDGTRFFYTSPNLKIYPHQWFWDSCFHVMINSALGRKEQAQSELATLLSVQLPSGFLPHMVYWYGPNDWIDRILRRYYTDQRISSIIQPAFLAHALDSLYRVSGPKVLERFLPAVMRYYDFLGRERVVNPKKCSLISIIHPWESGMDNAIAYDRVIQLKPNFTFFRWIFELVWILKINNDQQWDIKKIYHRDYFVVEDPLVNAVYADGLQVLSDLCGFARDSENEKKYALLSQKVSRDIVQCLWDETDEFFYYRKSITEELIKVKTVAGLAPLIIEGLSSEKVASLLRHLKDRHEFATAYPIPSAAIDERGFKVRTRLLWRGATWVSTNWYVCRALSRLKNNETAQHLLDEIIKRTLLLVKRNGFREYYDPHTGEGLGANGFGWSGLAYLMTRYQKE